MTLWSAMASAVALGIGANTDNLLVGLAYGLRGLRIGLSRNLLIAGITTAATLAPLTVGRSVRGLIPMVDADILGGLLLASLGLLNFYLEKRSSQRVAPGVKRHRVVDLRETLALASALSLNNIGLGFAGGVAGLGVASVGLSAAGFSVTLLWLGEWMSRTTVLPLADALRWLRIDGNLLVVGVGVVMMLGA
jgi:putative Mn2+ efflux pump MntP